MFIEERCKDCLEFFTPYTIKDDSCKCERKVQRMFKVKTLTKSEKYFKQIESYRKMMLKNSYKLKVENRENRIIK